MSDIIGLIANDGTRVEIRKSVINKFEWFSAMIANETQQGRIPKSNFYIETDAYSCRKMVEWMNYEANNTVTPFMDSVTRKKRELTPTEHVFIAEISDDSIVKLTYFANFYQLQELQNLLVVSIINRIQTLPIFAVRNMFNITEHGFEELEERKLQFEEECARKILQKWETF